MSDKKVVNVTTEFVKEKGSIAGSLTLGLLDTMYTPDHFVATVTHDDSSVSTGSGGTKEEAIRNANK